ncbi:MAG: LysR family transcriptional regulator [Kiloniellaceae bacterium]
MAESHDLTHIAVFATVAKLRSFTGAAKQLGLSKPTVSKHVSALERHLGARLLNRTTRSIRLTEVGSRFLARCQTILAELEDAESEVMRYRDRPQGRLKVTAPASLGSRYIAPFLRKFLDRYPKIELDMEMSEGKVDLATSEVDLAIRVAASPPLGGWLAELASCRQIVCAAPSYLRERGSPSELGDLRGHSCLTYAFLSSGETWPLRGPQGGCSIEMQGRVRCDSGETMRRAVLGGAGVALMPTFLVSEDAARGALVNLFPAYRSEVHKIYAVIPPGRVLTAKVDVFVAHLAETFGAPPRWDVALAGPRPCHQMATECC